MQDVTLGASSIIIKHTVVFVGSVVGLMKLQSMCINFTVLTPVCRECCVFYGSGKFENNDVFHDRDVFLEDYKEMNRSL